MIFYGILMENTEKKKTPENTICANTAIITARVKLGKQEKDDNKCEKKICVTCT